MKKIFYLASIAALAFSSCTKDSTDVVAPATPVGKTAFTATMSIGEGETRHGLGTNAEGKRVYVWDKGDLVSVNSDSQPAKNLPFIRRTWNHGIWSWCCHWCTKSQPG